MGRREGGDGVGPAHRGCRRLRGKSEIISKARQTGNQFTSPKGLGRERPRSQDSGLKHRTPEQRERVLEAAVGHGEVAGAAPQVWGLNGDKAGA